MDNTNKKFILEKAEDLTINKEEMPLSYEVQLMWMKYHGNNIILNNGQMVCMNYSNDIEIKISEFLHKMFVEFIESEKNINKSKKIKSDYIANTDNINNSSIYVKSIMDIIVNMDRAYKYAWNIAILLNEDVEEYKKFLIWQKDKLNISQDVYDVWELIYNIRNNIEHPVKLQTTFFRRNNGNVISPKIIYEGNEYDMLELGESAMKSVLILSQRIIAVSFLCGKYTVAFTDEARKKLFVSKRYIIGDILFKNV